MLGDIKKELFLDGYESSEMVLVEESDRNGKKHYFVVSDMNEAKKVCGGNNKRLIQVFTKAKEPKSNSSMCEYDEAFTCSEMLFETNRCKTCRANCHNAGKTV